MATTTETTRRTPGWSAWRGGIAAAVAIVGTVALFWWIDGVYPVSNGWRVIGGYVTLQVPYGVYDQVWLLVRALLGAYITVVFLIVFLQLVGTWRRLLADSGGET